MDAVIRTINKLVAPLKRRVMLMVGRAVLQLIDDAWKIQQLQLTGLAGEVLEKVERFQEYGFTSVPLPGAEAVLLAVGGDRAHGLVVGVEDRRYRLTGLEGGEVAIYDDQGQKVHIKRNGISVEGANIYLKSAGVIRIEGDGVEIHGDTYYQRDVNGLGERRTHTGGTDYHDDTYTTGAVITGDEHGLDAPDIPSDHPEGP